MPYAFRISRAILVIEYWYTSNWVFIYIYIYNSIIYIGILNPEFKSSSSSIKIIIFLYFGPSAQQTTPCRAFMIWTRVVFFFFFVPPPASQFLFPFLPLRKYSVRIWRQHRPQLLNFQGPPLLIGLLRRLPTHRFGRFFRCLQLQAPLNYRSSTIRRSKYLRRLPLES